MNRKDNRLDNMGPRLDLGPRPQAPRSMSRPAASSPAYRERPLPPPAEEGPVFPQGWRSASGSKQTAWEENQDSQDMDSAPYPQAEADEARTYPTQGVLVQPPVRLGMIRLLSWLALLTALAALVFSLLLPPSPAQTPAALELTESALSGAIAERVAKLEKDVSSLLLKMVTLEKNMEEAKNIAPAATSDLSARISALSGQVNDLGNKINLVGIPGSSSPASGTAAAGRVPSPPQAQAVPALNPAPPPNPVASSQVEERAGSKPPPLAAGASAPSNPSGQPRERYVVQPGDTLFAIAKNFNVAARDLRAWNGMAEDDVLKSGRVLVIY